MSTAKTSSPVVRARGLTKDFGDHRAVDGIDFDVQPGEAVGFLGPNGAGKTTTIRMLLNLLNPTRGELTLFGTGYADNRIRILRQINASSGTLALPGKLTVFQALHVFADLYGVADARSRIDTLLERFDLRHLRDRLVYSLSTGQQVRAALAKAFVNRPRLLLLDEPTASLDPDVADRVRTDLVEAVRGENTTVFLTSHNMREVETVCTRVLFINHGRIQAEGTPQELARQVRRSTVFLKIDPPWNRLTRLPAPGDAEIVLEGDGIRVDLDKEAIGPFLSRLVAAGAAIRTVTIHEPTLEDFFVHLARRPAEGGSA